jgi:metal-responsive CopG/Arc/MetJ family transcriptional regulator
MANPSISVDDEVLDQFDEINDRRRLAEELDLDTSRSEVIQRLMEEYIEEHREFLSEGNPKATPATAD